MGHEGCIVVYCVEKRRKSIPRIQTARSKVCRISKMVFLDMSLARLAGRSMEGPKRHVQVWAAFFGSGELLKYFNTIKYWRYLERVLEMGACRYTSQKSQSCVWKMGKREDVSLKAGRTVSSPSPNPAENGGPKQGISTADKEQGKTQVMLRRQNQQDEAFRAKRVA